MYKNFPDTYFQLDGSKYFLENIRKIMDSRGVNLRELDFNIQAFCFFIRAVQSTFNKEVENIKSNFKLSQNKTKSERISRLTEEYKKIAAEDDAIKFLIQKRHDAKSQRIRPAITATILDDVNSEIFFSMLMSPTTGHALEITEVGKIQSLKFKDWKGDEDVLQLCDRVYGRIEILAINAILGINNLIDG